MFFQPAWFLLYYFECKWSSRQERILQETASWQTCLGLILGKLKTRKILNCSTVVVSIPWGTGWENSLTLNADRKRYSLMFQVSRWVRHPCLQNSQLDKCRAEYKSRRKFRVLLCACKGCGMCWREENNNTVDMESCIFIMRAMKYIQLSLKTLLK